jgi:hypothetical protein
VTGPFAVGGQTITVVHITTDDYGDRSETGRATYPGCSVQPLTTVETLDTGDQVVTRWMLYGPPIVEASPVDRIEVDGGLFELDGELQLWRGLDGRPHHVEGYLKRSTG